jgi:hypothetical protein
MGYKKLHKHLISMLNQAHRISRWFNAAERLDLLPALMAMRDLTAQPGRRDPESNPIPDWNEECHLLDINANVVRQWKHRTATDSDLRSVLGEEPSRPGKRSGSGDADAIRHLQRLVKFVVEGKEEEAERLALALAERYGF